MFEAGRDLAKDLRNSSSKEGGARIKLAYAVLILLLLVFSARLVQLGTEESKTNRRGTGPSEWQAMRADITDRNGQLLATTIQGEGGRERKYAKLRIASHAVGVVSREGAGVEGRGVSGAEAYFDKSLKAGEAARLSIDFRAQAIIHNELVAASAMHGAKMAAAILMDSLTGEIIAAVQTPDFDPENIGKVGDMTFWPMRGTYEMGSTFKIFNTALAYEAGLDPLKKYDVSKPLVIGSAQIRDLGAAKTRPASLTIDEIMMYSSNIGSAKIALSLPKGTQGAFFRKLNLFTRLEVPGLGKTAVYRENKNPLDIETATFAFGHGIDVSMMNLLAAANAVVNGGVFITPRMTKLPDGAEVSGVRVISAQTSKRVRGVMFRVSEETTGKLARIAGINIGSKTATAEKRKPGGGYHQYRNMNSFIAVFPIESPRYIMLVVLDEPDAVPGIQRTAAHNVVPLSGRILDSIVPLLLK
ncbi:MAG: hypothetical protein LBG89_00100 [Rickettsiales bacterium]|jgi:cell division protein FtsI (penicillin-binding protein 3)|nr:hypothetical protein [Rickettsiales bacterium]